MIKDTVSPEFFENRYRKHGDPWNFAGSAYEQERFERIIKAVSHRRYRHALEPGCSIGTLTVRLAPLCDKITAFDLSETAVGLAKDRCAGFAHVDLTVAALGEETPVGKHDLVILSEVGYYFEPSRWATLVAVLTHRMQPGTTVLASHWLGYSEDHLQGGDEVHEVLRTQPRLRLEHEERHTEFRLDRFLRI